MKPNRYMNFEEKVLRNLIYPERIEENPEIPYYDIKPKYFDESQKFAQGGGVMNPAILELQRQQQNQQLQSNNPIMNGANQGLQSARNSMRMGDEDRQRALGLALMHFGRNVNNPAIGGPGFSGQLSRISNAMGPATDAYMDYENNAIQNQILAQQMEEKRLQQERAEQLARDKMAQREKMENARLAESNRYHTGLLNRENRLSKDERMYELGQQRTEALQQEYPGAIAFETMNPAAQREVSKELRDLSHKGKEYSKMLHNLDELEKIIDKHPNLSDSITAAWYPEGEGVIKSQIRAGIPKDERFAIERSNKLIKDILANKIQSVSSKTSTDIYKRILGETLPSTRRNTYKANKAVINDFRNEFKPMHEYIKLTPKMISKGFYLPIPVPEPEDYVDYNPENLSSANPNVNPKFSEEKMEEIRRLQQELGHE